MEETQRFVSKTRTWNFNQLTSISESEANEKRRKEKEEHSVEAYEAKFKEIEEITGEPDLDKLVERFIQGWLKKKSFLNFI